MDSKWADSLSTSCSIVISVRRFSHNFTQQGGSLAQNVETSLLYYAVLPGVYDLWWL